MMNSDASPQLPIRVKGKSSCAVHHGHHLVFVCQTCSLPACIECVSTVHRGHFIDKLEVVVAQKKEEMRKNMCLDIEKELSEFNQYICLANHEMEKDLKNFDDLDRRIMDSGEELKRQVDLFTEEQRQVCKQIKENNTAAFETYVMKKRTAFSDIKENIGACKEVLQSGSDILVYDTDIVPYTRCTSIQRPSLTKAKRASEHLQQTFGITVVSYKRDLSVDGTNETSGNDAEPLDLLDMNLATSIKQTNSTDSTELCGIDTTVNKGVSQDLVKIDYDRTRDSGISDSAMSYASEYTRKDPEFHDSAIGHAFDFRKKNTGSPNVSRVFDYTNRDSNLSDSAHVFNSTKRNTISTNSAESFGFNFTKTDTGSSDSATGQEIDYITTDRGSPNDCNLIDEFEAPDTKFIIYDIAPSTDGSAWICCKNSDVVTRFDSRGNVMEEITFSDVVNSLSVSPTTGHLWAGSGKQQHSIYEIISGIPSLKFQVDILQKCLCVLHDDSVAVGMEDSVSCFSNDGGQLGTAAIDGKPIRISECPQTNNIAVVIITTRYTSSVVIMSQDLEELTTFSLVSSTINIIATSIVYAGDGNLLIAAMSQTDECRNNVVLLRDGLLEESKANLGVKAKSSSMNGCQHPVITIDDTGILWTVFHDDIKSPQHVQLLQYLSDV